jgi:propanediol dehydratase large subunit
MITAGIGSEVYVTGGPCVPWKKGIITAYHASCGFIVTFANRTRSLLNSGDFLIPVAAYNPETRRIAPYRWIKHA